VFIATPLLVVLKEREPDFAKRREAGLQEKLEVTAEEAAVAAPLVAELADEGVEVETVAATPPGDGASAAARREARRKRRRAKPHGRAR
jgi:hypothetical protein